MAVFDLNDLYLKYLFMRAGLRQIAQLTVSAVMRACITVLVLGIALQAHGARELKWGWSSAGSLGQLSTTTGANTNSGLLSTCAPHMVSLSCRNRVL